MTAVVLSEQGLLDVWYDSTDRLKKAVLSAVVLFQHLVFFEYSVQFQLVLIRNHIRELEGVTHYYCVSSTSKS